MKKKLKNIQPSVTIPLASGNSISIHYFGEGGGGGSGKFKPIGKFTNPNKIKQKSVMTITVWNKGKK